MLLQFEHIGINDEHVVQDPVELVKPSAHTQLDSLRTVFKLVSHASQVEGSEQEVHASRVELQGLQTPETRVYPLMHTQLLLLRVMNFDWSQDVQTVELEQMRQPSIKLLQVSHCEPARV